MTHKPDSLNGFVNNKVSQYIDFTRGEIFDWVVDSYLATLVSSLKIKKKEIEVTMLIPSINYRYGKKIKGLKYPKYLFSSHVRFQFLNVNSRTIYF